MAIKPKRDPQSEYDRNSNLAEAFGWVLLAGLAVELAFAFILDKLPLEKVLNYRRGRADRRGCLGRNPFR